MARECPWAELQVLAVTGKLGLVTVRGYGWGIDNIYTTVGKIGRNANQLLGYWLWVLLSRKRRP